jgi:hypothetical protein
MNFFKEDDEAKQTKLLYMATQFDDFKVAFLHKGGCLIYIALSKAKEESVSYLKKQLEFIHC